jgi:UDP-N-acetylmuramyl pentapeptide phosphotransferase/UDP-N-acetylglucosamine-1-phosphate transferase
MIYLLTIFTIILSFFLIFLCNNKNFLLSKSGDKHQEFSSQITTPLIGGIIIFCSIFTFKIYNFDIFLIFISSIFIIGLFSDLKKMNSPILRLILQLLVIVLTVFSLNLILVNTRIIFLDYLLNNYYFAIIFTSFCILIIVNGTNFIDGINSLVIGYYIIISFVLLFLQHKGFILSSNFLPISLLICLTILYYLNLFNKLYLGDSGAYLLGFIFSIELINLYLKNTISPFFIILLLWYPAFENLFSILRKASFKKSPINPDTNHLHQLIFSYFVKKNLSSLKANNITGISINIYNGVIVLISLLDPLSTEIQIILIIVNILVYTFLYMKLFKYK